MDKLFSILFWTCLLLRISFENLKPASFVISQSGQYCLGNNITYTPSATDQIIYINANNVVLDLNNYVLKQSGGLGTLNGIEIAAGVSGVLIQNGTIQGVSGAGVYINSGCRNISLENIQTFTANQGIVLNGTSANTISNCKISNATIRYTTNQGIIATNSSLLSLDKILIDTCATTTFSVQLSNAATQPLQGLSVTNLSIKNGGLGLECASYRSAFFDNCIVFGCLYAGLFKGFYFSATSAALNNDIILRNCSVQSCFTSSGNIIAMELTNTNNSILYNCTVTNCGAAGTDAKGFLIFQSQNINLENCKTAKIESTNAGTRTTNGFEINTASNINLINCESLQAGQGTSQGGFALTSATSCALKGCTANNGSNGTSSNCGFVLSSCTLNLLDNCVALNGITFGFALLTGATNNTFNNCQSVNCGTGFSIQASSNIFTRCQAQQCTTNGFDIPTGTTSITIKNCIAQGCSTTGFNNTSNVGNVFENNIAVNNTNGCVQSGATSSNRFLNNMASNNSTNYSGSVNNIVSAGGTVRLGGNLDG